MTFLKCLESCLGLYSCRPCRPNAEAPNDFEKSFQKTMFFLSCLTACTGAGVGCAAGSTAVTAGAVPFIGALSGTISGATPFFVHRRNEESQALLANEPLPDPNIHVRYAQQPGANLGG